MFDQLLDGRDLDPGNLVRVRLRPVSAAPADPPELPGAAIAAALEPNEAPSHVLDRRRTVLVHNPSPASPGDPAVAFRTVSSCARCHR